ncbi:protein of unknown function [Streptomyces murinus]
MPLDTHQGQRGGGGPCLAAVHSGGCLVWQVPDDKEAAGRLADDYRFEAVLSLDRGSMTA